VIEEDKSLSRRSMWTQTSRESLDLIAWGYLDCWVLKRTEKEREGPQDRKKKSSHNIAIIRGGHST